MRCWGRPSDLVAALLACAVLLPSVWAAKHSGVHMDATTMLWVDAAFGAGYLLLQRVLSRR